VLDICGGVLVGHAGIEGDALVWLLRMGIELEIGDLELQRGELLCFEIWIVVQ
jgi:hypothetical protein